MPPTYPRVADQSRTIDGSDTYVPLLLPSPSNLQARIPVTWLSQIQTSHGFTAAGGALASSNLNDTSDYVFGTQSARVTTTGAGGSGSYLEKTGLSFTLLTKSLVIMAKVDDITHLKQVYVYVGDASYTNSWRWQEVNVTPTTRPAHWASGEWAQITLSFSDAIVNSGSPVRSQTNTQVRVLMGDDAAGAITWHLNGVGTVPEARTTFPNGVCSLTFDDSYGSHFSIARPAMDKYGYAGTAFPILDALDTASMMTTAQVKQLAASNGWEVGAHASTAAAHALKATGMTSAQRLAEARTLKAWQAANGFTSDSYAYPQGAYDAATVVDTRAAFSCARTIYQESYETAPCADPFRVRAFNPTAMSLAQAQAVVDLAYANGGWLVWVFHDINAGGTGGNAWSTTNFTGLVDYLNTKGIAVRTMGEVIRAATP